MTDFYINDLAALQHADSMFPSGAVSFSWGLETLFNLGIVTRRDELREFIIAHVRGRWADMDRPLIWHAHRADGDMATLCRLDALAEAQSLGSEMRTGSRRMGLALLGVHKRLGTPFAAEFAQKVHLGETPGHLPVVQGIMWRGLGFCADRALVMSAHGLCTGMLGAAIRLSIVGHMDAQRIHTELLPLVEPVLQRPITAPEQLHSFIPQIEIASMIHETDDVRLFVN